MVKELNRAVGTRPAGSPNPFGFKTGGGIEMDGIEYLATRRDPMMGHNTCLRCEDSLLLMAIESLRSESLDAPASEG